MKRSVVGLNRIAASLIGGFQPQVGTKPLISVARSLFLIAAGVASLLGCDARALPTADAQVRVRQNLDAGWLFARQAHGSGELGSFDRHVIGADKIEPAFQGASLPDPAGLLQGNGKFMRHVKLRPGVDVEPVALRQLIEAAYSDIKARVENG